MLKLLKIRKIDITNYNKTPTFLLNVTFVTFVICLWEWFKKTGLLPRKYNL